MNTPQSPPPGIPGSAAAVTTRFTPVVLLAGLLLVMVSAGPALAQRCTTQNGQTICCDNSGNCYSK